MRSPFLLVPLSVLFLLAAGAGGPLPRAHASTRPSITINGHDFAIPSSNSRMVYRLARSGPPEVLELWRTSGREWRIYWDFALGTPRSLIPLEQVQIVPPEILDPEPDFPALVEAAGAFIDRHAAFLGADTSLLGEPFVTQVEAGWVLVFPQTTRGGIPVRGANVRLVLDAEGGLLWLKAFVLRACPDPEGTILERGPIESSTASPGDKVHSAALEIGFREGDQAPIPIWSLSVTDAAGVESENIIDARTGSFIARRQVVKYFDPIPEGTPVATGEVLGFSPRREDIFSSPQTTNPELLTYSPLDGAVIRNSALLPVAETSGDGAFVAPLPEEAPKDLIFSLEHGAFVPGRLDAEMMFFREIISVQGVREDFFESPFRPGEDVNKDKVPDLTGIGAVDSPLTITFNDVPGAGGPAPTLIEGYHERAWWLQCYHHAQEMHRVFQATQGKFNFFLTESLFHPLSIWAFPTGTFQSYRPTGVGQDTPSKLYSSMWVQAGNEQIEVVPTLLMHEVGHHIFFSLTRSRNAPTDIEEGLADALVGLSTRRSEVGFLAPGEATSLGFRLGTEEPNDIRSAARADIGNAFWTLREEIPSEELDPTINAAYGLLIHWLRSHVGSNGDARAFEPGMVIVDELLRIDGKAPFCPLGQKTCLPPHEREVRKAFHGKKTIFDAPFVRGDANLDQKLDISDALSILAILFGGQGKFHDCWNAVDTDNSGKADISDAIFLLDHLFRGGQELPAPGGVCGLDPELPGTDGNLGCIEFTCPL
ncbi:MAG TPA: hypothetical protein VMT52_19435 [Planctomycetota bacterium]|nr:hypothetical protein [Planctomycetota bacterium]